MSTLLSSAGGENVTEAEIREHFKRLLKLVKEHKDDDSADEAIDIVGDLLEELLVNVMKLASARHGMT